MAISRTDTLGLRLLLGLALSLATWFALTPQPVTLPEVALADKWAHLATYLLLAFLVDASWPEPGFDWRKWGFLLAYGILIELIQVQLPNRFFSLADIVANATGIALYGFLIVPLLRACGIR
jgi:VanZ family protein